MMPCVHVCISQLNQCCPCAAAAAPLQVSEEDLIGVFADMEVQHVTLPEGQVGGGVTCGCDSVAVSGALRVFVYPGGGRVVCFVTSAFVSQHSAVV